MPTYEFLCRKCEKPFELIWSLSEYETETKKKIKCPNAAAQASCAKFPPSK